MASVDPKTGKPVKSSSGRLCGWNTIFGRDGDHGEPYMTRVWFGRLRLHIFHRGDNDPDAHSHPWHFWTFPLVSYVEEVLLHVGGDVDKDGNTIALRYAKVLNVVPAWHWTYRDATHTHRVIAAASKPAKFFRPHGGVLPSWLKVDSATKPGKIVTLVWRSKEFRKWDFLKERAGVWCRVFWRDYVFNGGKDAPCSPPGVDHLK